MSPLVFLSTAEISKVRSSLFQINGMKKEPLVLPDGIGPPVSRSEKVYVPVKEHPDVSVKQSALTSDAPPTSELFEQASVVCLWVKCCKLGLICLISSAVESLFGVAVVCRSCPTSGFGEGKAF